MGSRRSSHPVRVEIVRQGWPTVAAFARANGINEDALGAVLRGTLKAYPKLMRQVCEALQLPEEVLFPERVFRPVPLDDEVVA
jgi:lambda repressor-like predicted transcriptional regulator